MARRFAHPALPMYRPGSPMFLLLLALLAGGPAPAAAQGQRIRLEGIEVVGKRHMPEVMMVITRQNLKGTYSLELRESFLPKIVRSVEEDPF